MIPDSSLAYGVDPVIGIPVAILLLLFSAFFSGSEAALFSLQAVERESIRHKGSAGQRVSRLLEAPRRTLASVLMGNELANVTLSTVCAGMVLKAWPHSPWMNFVLATPLLVLFGEITPKTLALRHNSLFARAISLPLQAWATLVSPFRWLLTRIADATIRLLGGSASDLVSTIGERQIRHLIDESHEAGEIREIEQEIIHRVFDFSEIPVSQVMTPLSQMVSIPLNMPFAQILALVKRERRSRIPVYKGRSNHIVGILLTKDLLRFKDRNPPGSRQLQRLLQTPYYVPDTKTADDLLQEFQRYRTHIAIVVNEHGALGGVVTLDDLLEELVGEMGLEEEERTEEASE